MSKRHESGGTLALIVVAAIVIIIVAIGFFVVSRMLGGGLELQHSTDAGNLNVSKQALKAPAIKDNALINIGGQPDLLSEFSQCFDPADPTKKVEDLQYYNKAVGKAFLVSMNAAAEESAQAGTNAKSEIGLVQGPGGIGDQLTQQLAAASKIEGFFNSVAGSNTARMLSRDQQALVKNSSQAALYQTSYMLKNVSAPSNLFINPNTLPPGAPNILAIPADAKDRSTSVGNRSFLCGYHPIQITSPGSGVDCGTMQFVPMRPGEQPHSVGQAQFTTDNASPLPGGGGSLIPPNAFGNTSQIKETTTQHDVSMRSSSIIGVVDTTIGDATKSGGIYPAQIPGFVILDNGGIPFSAHIPATPSPMDDEGTSMMAGFKIAVVNGSPHLDPNGGSTFTQIAATGPTNADPTKHVDPSLGNALKPPISNQSELDNFAKDMNNHVNSPITCDEKNTPDGVKVGGVPSQNAFCKQIFDQGNVPPVTPSGLPAPVGASDPTGLMPVEALKAAVIAVRGGGPGCATTSLQSSALTQATAAGATAAQVIDPDGSVCGVLKNWTKAGVGNDVQFGTPGTIKQLVALAEDSTQPGSILKQLVQRMSEMKGDSASESDAVLDTIVTPGQVLALYYDTASGKFLTVPQLTSLPAGYVTTTFSNHFNNSGIIPDGNVQAKERTINDLVDSVIDKDSDGGYPHPWDCAYPSATSHDRIQWTPSSGYDNLLGVLKFKNCVSAADGEWCCPC